MTSQADRVERPEAMRYSAWGTTAKLLGWITLPCGVGILLFNFRDFPWAITTSIFGVLLLLSAHLSKGTWRFRRFAAITRNCLVAVWLIAITLSLIGAYLVAAFGKLH